MTIIHSILSWTPHWLVGLITMIVPAIVVLLIYRWFTRRLIRLAGRYSPFLQRLLARGQGPASLFLVIVVSGVALAGANFPWNVTAAIGRALLVAFVLAVGWAAQASAVPLISRGQPLQAAAVCPTPALASM